MQPPQLPSKHPMADAAKSVHDTDDLILQKIVYETSLHDSTSLCDSTRELKHTLCRRYDRPIAHLQLQLKALAYLLRSWG